MDWRNVLLKLAIVVVALVALIVSGYVDPSIKQVVQGVAMVLLGWVIPQPQMGVGANAKPAAPKPPSVPPVALGCLLALAVVLLVACPPFPVYPDSGTGGTTGAGGSVVVDAGDECTATVLDACGLAGEHLCRLGCRSNTGAPLWRTPAGRSFADVCREAAADGRSWRPDCLARITDCSQVESAYRTKAGAVCAL